MSRSRYCRFWYLVTVFSLVHRGLFFQGVHICVPANSGEHSMVIFIIALISLIKVPPSWSENQPKFSPPNTITLRNRSQCVNSEKKKNIWSIISVQWLSRVRHFATPRITAPQAFLSITISRGSLKLMSIESVMPSSHLILCHPLLLLPPIPPLLDHH